MFRPSQPGAGSALTADPCSCKHEPPTFERKFAACRAERRGCRPRFARLPSTKWSLTSEGEPVGCATGSPSPWAGRTNETDISTWGPPSQSTTSRRSAWSSTRRPEISESAQDPEPPRAARPRGPLKRAPAAPSARSRPGTFGDPRRTRSGRVPLTCCVLARRAQRRAGSVAEARSEHAWQARNGSAGPGAVDLPARFFTNHGT